MLFRSKKILLKGNHDYWWTTITNMKNYLKENKFNTIDFLHINSYFIEDKIIVGTRGWNLLETENSEKMLNRENNRLKLSIEDGIQKFGKEKEIVVFMNYPPTVSYTHLDVYKRQAIYPKTEYQRCIVHQIRNSLKYVPYTARKELANDLKTVYKASTEELGYTNLLELEEKWKHKYPGAIDRKSTRLNSSHRSLSRMPSSA